MREVLLTPDPQLFHGELDSAARRAQWAGQIQRAGRAACSIPGGCDAFPGRIMRLPWGALPVVRLLPTNRRSCVSRLPVLAFCLLACAARPTPSTSPAPLAGRPDGAPAHFVVTTDPEGLLAGWKSGEYTLTHHVPRQDIDALVITRTAESASLVARLSSLMQGKPHRLPCG